MSTKPKFNNSAMNNGYRYAMERFQRQGELAIHAMERLLQEAKDFDDYGDFDKGVVEAIKELTQSN